MATMGSLNEMEEEYADEVMFGDILYQVPKGEIEQQPYKFIGLLQFKCGNRYGRGTAFQMSDNILFTVAHNMCESRGKHYDKDSYYYFPHVCGRLGKGIKIVDYYIPPEYLIHPTVNNDYAILKLEAPLKQ